MIIVSIKNIKSLEDFSKRIDRIVGQYGKNPDVIILENKKTLFEYTKLLLRKPEKEVLGYSRLKKTFCSYTFRGIPLILPWQIRI